MTTTKDAFGVGVPPVSAPQVRASGHGSDVAPEATSKVVRAEARHEQGTGSEPSNAPGHSLPRPRTELRRVTIHEHDDRNGCETVRGVGFSWRCTCGERGKVYTSRGIAALEKAAHERGHAR